MRRQTTRANADARPPLPFQSLSEEEERTAPNKMEGEKNPLSSLCPSIPSLHGREACLPSSLTCHCTFFPPGLANGHGWAGGSPLYFAISSSSSAPSPLPPHFRIWEYCYNRGKRGRNEAIHAQWDNTLLPPPSSFYFPLSAFTSTRG